jgi:hypothetical protein
VSYLIEQCFADLQFGVHFDTRICIRVLTLSVYGRSAGQPRRSRRSSSFFLSASAVAQRAQFRWANHHQDSALFAKVARIFKRELSPDGVFAVKSVERVGIWRESALVVITSKRADSEAWELFEAFNFNTRTHVKASVPKASFERWEFERLAHFDSRENPDIVFRHLSCDECDSADHLLGSFRYDPKEGIWNS